MIAHKDIIDYQLDKYVNNLDIFIISNERIKIIIKM